MNIFEVIRDEYIGDNVLVRNNKGEMITVQITRVDVFCGKHRADINVHVEHTPGCEKCYNLFLNDYRNNYTSYLPKAFLNQADYNKYYDIHEVRWEKIN